MVRVRLKYEASTFPGRIFGRGRWEGSRLVPSETPVRADVGLLQFPFIFGRRINGPASTIFDGILLGCGVNGKEQSGEPTTYQTVAA